MIWNRAVWLLASLAVFSCTKEPDVVVLDQSSTAYTLAKELAGKLPALDPDENQVIASSAQFRISAGELVDLIENHPRYPKERVKQLNAERLKSFVQDMIQEVAERKLLLSAAEKASVEVNETDIDSVVHEQAMRVGGEERFKEVALQRGIDMQVFRTDIREMLTIGRYLDEILQSRVEISEEQIRSVYEQDKLATVRHILLMTQGKSEAEKAKIRQKMEDILRQARAGADFAALAKKHTEDPGSRENGGLYEDFERGRMVKPFEDAAFSVPVGEISDIVETRYGYHILKIIERKPETRPLEDVREELLDNLRNQSRSEVYSTHIQELKTKSGLELMEL